MLVEYKNLKIRQATLQDVNQLMMWWNDGKVMEHAGFPHGLKTNEEKIMNEILTNDETHRRMILEIDHQRIGEMSYRELNEISVEIGIKICDFSRQEKGLGRLYLSMLIQYLFEKGYQTIQLDTDLENKRAQHVYELLGFEKKRVNINSWINQIGEKRSSVDYELTQQEFRNYCR